MLLKYYVIKYLNKKEATWADDESLKEYDEEKNFS